MENKDKPVTVAIEKQWDGNECETDGANGRIYVSRGRWQWVVVVDGQSDRAFDTRRDARAHADTLSAPAPAGLIGGAK